MKDRESQNLDKLMKEFEIIGRAAVKKLRSENERLGISNVEMTEAGLLYCKLPTMNARNQCKLREREHRGQSVQAYGGMLTGERAAQIFGIRLDKIEEWRRDNKVLAVLYEGVFEYPVWQFTDCGVLPGVHRVIQEFEASETVNGDWAKLSFFTRENDYVVSETGQKSDLRTPVDALRVGEIECVIHAAKIYMKQGAR